jgi:hypothetical protein
MRSNGITLNADTHSLLTSTWFGRVIPADTIWNIEGVDADDIREMLALNGIDAGVQMPYGDYIQAVANAFGLDAECMRNDVDSKSDDLGPDYDFETSYCILDLMELESNAVVIV